MANASKMAAENPVRLMIVGYPGSGKTGSLVPLINAGFKLRILDFDGNMDPIFQFAKPEMLANVDVMMFEDKLKKTPAGIEPIGQPKAFLNALDAMDRWKYKELQPDGTEVEVDLGASKDWGSDTIVVLDSTTSMGKAAFRHSISVMNKTVRTITQPVWNYAMSEMDAFLERLTSPSNRFHVVVLAHLVMIGPKDIEDKDDPTTKELKERIANIVPTRLFPSALGQKLPPLVGGHFPTLVEASRKIIGGKVKRIIRTLPREELDLKVPTAKLPEGDLEIADGMLRIFEALSPSSVALVRGQKAQGSGLIQTSAHEN